MCYKNRIDMLKIIVFILLLGSLPVYAQSDLEISGKLRTLEALELRLEDIEGKTILSAEVRNDGTFSMGPVKIVPDLYFLWFGKTKQPIYLTNTKVTIKGYYDHVNPGNSSLVFTGIDEFLKLSEWIPKEEIARKKTINKEVQDNLRGTMFSALAYLSGMTAYEPNKMLLDFILPEDREALTVKWLVQRVDSLSKFAKTGSGVSLASASVAGVAALVKAYYPNLTGAQIRNILLNSVTSRKGVEVEKGIIVDGKQAQDLFLFEDLCLSGGILNAYRAIMAADKFGK